MKTKHLLPILGLLMTFLGTNPAMADLYEPIPITAMIGTKVTICHGTSSATNPSVKITVSTSSLGANGHGGHKGSQGQGKGSVTKQADYFYNYTTNTCDGGSSLVTDCPVGTKWGETASQCESCLSGQVVDDTGEGCTTPTGPSVEDVTTTVGTVATLSGTVGTSPIISSISLTKAGTNIAVGSAKAATNSNAWSKNTSNALTYGTYTVTAIDGNQLQAQGTLTVNCPTATPWDGSACTAPVDCSAVSGQVVTNGSCACPASTPDTVNNHCVAACLTGQTRDSDGVCTTTSSSTHTPTITSIGGVTYEGDTTKATVAGFTVKSDSTTSAAIKTENQTPRIIGQVDTDSNSALGSDSFSVTFTNTTTGATFGGVLKDGDNFNSNLVNGSKKWSFVPATLTAGVYDIVVTRAGTSDISHNELIVGISICDADANKYILRSEWIEAKESTKAATTAAPHYYLGKCNASPALPTAPAALANETLPTPSCSGTSDTDSISNATAKLATIMNATTANGTVGTVAGAAFRYGEKESVSGTMNILGAAIDPVDEGKATGVTLTDVTINNVVIDASTNEITVTGGTTTGGTITNGMITAGKNASGHDVRGRVVRGEYDVTVSGSQTTKARRVIGTLSNATITNATTITSTNAGVTKTVISLGTIVSGNVSANGTTYGTVNNALIQNATITTAVHCFTTGTVGSRGQSNWKEEVN